MKFKIIEFQDKRQKYESIREYYLNGVAYNMRFKFKVSDELFTNLLFLSLIGMYFLGLVVILNVYLYIHLNSNLTHQNK